MAVVQISRISHRSGVSDNLPQLARGEIGLAVDTRQVYIGNGGADSPLTENLQILTNRSDVITLADTYTYSDAQIGFNAQTGASSITPVVRSLQNKLDDVASVRDFGAKGDGATDDTAAINRALYELFSRETEHRIRRSLFFPAGNYIVSDTIKIPTYAKLVGEGPNSTTITSSDATGPIAQTADSLQQVDASVGASSATRPSYITVEGMSFTSTTDINTLVVDQAKACTFINCAFAGPNSTVPSTVGNSKANVLLSSTVSFETEFVTFKSCTMHGQSFNVLADNDMKSVLFDGCNFYTAFNAFKIGESITGSNPSVSGPRSMKVTGSLFDGHYNNAIHIYSPGKDFISAYNHFRDCGNNGLGNGNASSDVILFEGTQCYSVGDSFDRPAGDLSATTRRIDHGTRNIVTEEEMFAVGSHIRRAEASVALVNNGTSTTGITFADNGDFYAIEINYYISRNSKVRQGTLTITHDATAQVIDDSFQENNGDVGVSFALSNTSNITTLNYTTDSQTTGTLYLSTRIIR